MHSLGTVGVITAAIIAQAMAYGQDRPPASIVLSDVPIWTIDGTAPARFPDNFVFLDVDSADLIVSYPLSLGSRTGNTEGRNTFRVILPAHVRPHVAMRLRQDHRGRFEFGYTLSNGSSAQSPITRWLWQRSRPADSEIRLPEYWRTIEEEPALEQCGTSCFGFDWLGHADPLESIQDPSELDPGVSIPEIRVISAEYPGFLLTYFQGGHPIRENSAQLPSVVEEQLRDAQSIDRSTWPVIIVGPRFPSNTSPTARAMELKNDMRMLEDSNLLDTASPFVSEVLHFLDRRATGNSCLSVLRNGVHAETSFEKQLLRVITSNFACVAGYRR